jgi:hypothetical protein
MGRDVDAALAGKLLQRLGDRTGIRAAGLLDPLRGNPCGGPCSENSGSTTSRGGSLPRVATSIRPLTCAIFSLMIAHAPARSAALTASLLRVWMQVARHG